MEVVTELRVVTIWMWPRMTVTALAGACSTKTAAAGHSAAAQQPQLAATEKTKSDGSPLDTAVSALEA